MDTRDCQNIGPVHPPSFDVHFGAKVLLLVCQGLIVLMAADPLGDRAGRENCEGSMECGEYIPFRMKNSF